MLALLFYIGENLYAIDSLQVVEVIPRVNLRPIHQAPDYIVGLCNYRGAIVTVLDLGQLIQGQPCRRFLSTRIIIANYLQPSGVNTYLGLIAERVTETLKKSDDVFSPVHIEAKDKSYLGGIAMDKRGMIQQIHLDRLPVQLQQATFLEAKEQL